MTKILTHRVTQDADGMPVIFVLIPNLKKECRLFPADWQRLLSHGLAHGWIWNSSRPKYGYLRMNYQKPGKLVAVARFVMGAVAGEKVGFKTNDVLNLRRDNLKFIIETPQGMTRRRETMAPTIPEPQQKFGE